MQGLDVGAVVHYTGQYEDDNLSLTSLFGEFSKPQTPRSGPRPLGARKVREWITLDLITSYTFNLPPPASAPVPGLAKDGGKNVKMDGKEKNVMPVSTAEYKPCGWRAWLNNTTISVGMQNVFDEDPPFVGRRFRERLRRVACHHQRPVLVPPVKEKILTGRNSLDPI